jgi:NAD(P)-dependent dehydrogenase (short-subunit alcohol dehydrogenase family)
VSTVDGRVALVTGGGRGLGRSHALALAAAGNRVVVNDTGAALDGSDVTDPEAAARVVEEIRRAGGIGIADDSDVATHEGAQAAVDRALTEFSRLDAVVHSAGILRDRSFGKLEPEDFDAVLRVHLGSPAYVTHAAWNALGASGSGRVVLTSSAGGLFGQFGQANYGAAKAALVGLMNVLRLEGARKGIAVNTIAPVAATRMTKPLLPSEVVEGLGTASISDVVTFLGSPSCMHSGLILDVGAGLAARIRVMSSGVREIPADGDADQMNALLDELASLDDYEGYEDSPSALARLMDRARKPVEAQPRATS